MRARVFSSSNDDDVHVDDDDDGNDGVGGGAEDDAATGATAGAMQVVALHNMRRRRSRGLCALAVISGGRRGSRENALGNFQCAAGCGTRRDAQLLRVDDDDSEPLSRGHEHRKICLRIFANSEGSKGVAYFLTRSIIYEEDLSFYRYYEIL